MKCTIVYPDGLNWFYAHIAKVLHRDLLNFFAEVELVPSSTASTRLCTGEIAIIVSLYECALSARNADSADHSDKFIANLKRFKCRVLYNYDCIYSEYFTKQFVKFPGVITSVMDVGAKEQHYSDMIYGVPYHWLPENYASFEMDDIVVDKLVRPIPWALIGHMNKDRVSLASICRQELGGDGFVYLPQLKPYGIHNNSLTYDDIFKLLKRTKFYVWGSHHSYPYHEGLRSLHAVISGAAPAKIDPRYYGMYQDVPWVYRSVSDLRSDISENGHESMLTRARKFLSNRPTIGQSVSALISESGDLL